MTGVDRPDVGNKMKNESKKVFNKKQKDFFVRYYKKTCIFYTFYVKNL